MPFSDTGCLKIAGVYRMHYAPFTTNVGGTISATVNYLGLTGPEGIRFTREDHKDLIFDDENGPDAPQDVIYRGCSAFMEFVLEEVDRLAVSRLLYPWGTDPVTGAQVAGRGDMYGAPGRFGCQVVGKLEAIPLVGNAADGMSEPTATSANSPPIPSDGGAAGPGRQFLGVVDSPVVESMDTSPRFIPIRFRCFPFYTDGDPTSDPAVVMWNWIDAATT